MIESVLYAAVAPLALLLVASIWSYPAVLEEIVKWGILKLGVDRHLLRARDGAVVGLVFGLSEAVLFSLNAWSGGEWGPLVSRLLLTVPMHAVTGGVTAWGIPLRSSELRRDAVSLRELVGVLLAMVIHGLFNYWVR